MFLFVGINFLRDGNFIDIIFAFFIVEQSYKWKPKKYEPSFISFLNFQNHPRNDIIDKLITMIYFNSDFTFSSIFLIIQNNLSFFQLMILKEKKNNSTFLWKVKSETK